MSLHRACDRLRWWPSQAFDFFAKRKRVSPYLLRDSSFFCLSYPSPSLSSVCLSPPTAASGVAANRNDSNHLYSPIIQSSSEDASIWSVFEDTCNGLNIFESIYRRISWRTWSKTCCLLRSIYRRVEVGEIWGREGESGWGRREGKKGVRFDLGMGRWK